MTTTGQNLVELLGSPRSVAVIGASSNLNAPSGRPLAYLTRYGYEGRIAVVNPRHAEVAGLRTVPAAADLEPGEAEVAIVNLPAPLVPAAIADLAGAGVRAAVVIASGFERADSKPRAELLEVLARTDLRLIGPNCVGTLATPASSYLTFSSVLQTQRPRQGSIALVTQSGALGNSLLQSLLRRGAGISRWFSTGDELDVGALEVVSGLLGLDDVRGVGLFLEGVTDLEWLASVAEAIERTGKPVYVVKAARTDLGRLTASGHTGRVVGSSDVSRAILEEAGIAELGSLDHMADVLVALDILGGAPAERVAVVSVSGASAVVAADRVQQAPELRMAALPFDSAELREGIDPRVEISNPLDVPFLGETDVFARAVTTIAANGHADAVVAIESGLAHTESELVDRLVARSGDVPLVVSYLSPDDPLSAESVERLAAASIVVVPTPERAIDALAHLRHGRPAQELPAAAAAAPAGGLEAVAALPGGDALCWALWRVVDSLDAARAALADLGPSVVLKAAGRTLVHRSEAGAVRVGVDAGALPEAYAAIERICSAHGDAVVVQRMAGPGFEVLLAGIRDPEFGPVVLLRPGGVLAELLRDQVVLHGGWSPEARVRRLRAAPLGQILDGYRGGRRYDAAALVELAGRVLEIVASGATDFIEINPVLVHADGVSVIDAICSPSRRV
jgi:acyl-CoA synthetase (NDP forming)